jgi:hypothetical protein
VDAERMMPAQESASGPTVAVPPSRIGNLVRSLLPFF